MGAAGETPRAPDPGSPSPPQRSEASPNPSQQALLCLQRAGHWAPEPAGSCQGLTLPKGWMLGCGGVLELRELKWEGCVCNQCGAGIPGPQASS